MWQELNIVHLDPKEKISAEMGPSWKTCIRQIVFLAPGAAYTGPFKPRAILRGHEAHRFLVEICAGLHSPLVGETEVFGQFKAFRDVQNWAEAWEPLLDAVEEDVKKIRRKHLTALGAQSYGSLARRRLTAGTPVVLVGAGRLAQDLLPWLSGSNVQLVVRSLGKKEGWWSKASVSTLDEAGTTQFPQGAHWLIAAPLTNEELESLWGNSQVGTVMDFRGEARFHNTPKVAKDYLDLSLLFGELEAVRGALAVKRTVAMEAAAELSRLREVSVHHRPFGWEDAFA
jgi:glutamyl-tRNA reductase